MRVLASADIHGEHGVYRWLVQKADEVEADLIILAGDLLGSPEGLDAVEAAGRADAARVTGILNGTRVPVLFVMGNEDCLELEPTGNGIRSIHNERFELGDASFVGYQYSLPFKGGIFEKPEDEIGADLDRLERLVDESTILVTHSPAYGILDIGMMDTHSGSRSILELIQKRKPRAHIHGHIHEQFGRFDRHFNVASEARRRGMVIDLDTMKHVVID
jgi:Icc-related predicted phosphoesterase